MACQNCQNSNSSVSVFDIQYIYNSNCTDCNSICNGNIYDAKCVVYTGSNLPCSTISTNDSLELALQKIDEILCSTSGDYSTYSINCLPGPITTEAQFVEAITDYACTTRTTLTTFTGTTFPAYQNSVNSRFLELEFPSITCTAAGVTDTDSLQTVLNKYCIKFDTLDGDVDLSAVDWDQCFTVVTPPTTVPAGFDLLIDQICEIKTIAEDGASLPVFNNTGSCLPTPGSADTLESTVEKIKTRLCQTGTFTVSGMTWGCVTNGTDLQTTIQNTITKVSAITALMPTFDGGDFTVTPVDEDDPCAGVTVSLATSLNQDRYVAASDTDSDPGTLADKLVEGENIELDYLSNPGQVIINSLGGDGDHKVLASSVDDTPGYLDEKIEGMSGSNGISLDASYDAGEKKLLLSPSLDMGEFFNAFIIYLNGNPSEKERFCELVNSCPSPCAQPQNVSAVYISGGGTTTSTTTTSTSTTTTTTTTP